MPFVSIFIFICFSSSDIVIATVFLLYPYVYMCEHKWKQIAEETTSLEKQSKKTQPPSDYGGSYGIQAQNKCD